MKLTNLYSSRAFLADGFLLSLLVLVVVIPIVAIKNTNHYELRNAVKINKLSNDPSKLNEDERSRINCFLDAESPFVNLTEYACERRNCIYNRSVSHPLVPVCYFDRKNLGYKLKKQTNDFEYDLIQSGKAPFPGVIENIRLIIEHLGKNILRVKIIDPNQLRYEVPMHLNKPERLKNPAESAVQFEYTESSHQKLFEFKIKRSDTNESVFDTSFGGFVYSTQFLQISTKLFTNYIFGFGENNHEKFKHNLNYASWGMFARDNAPGWGRNRNNYGHHPFYLGIEKSGKSHGVLLFNSNAMEYLFTPSPSLTLRSIGGILDFYFIIDDTPQLVLQHYHQLIGLPIFPPYWSFGYQLSRWGYNNLTHIKTVVERTRAAKIPHDVQYADIDYMLGYRIFTIDPVNFKGIYDYFQSLQESGMKTVLILDPALVIERNYTPFIDGLKDDVYIKWPKNLAPVDDDLYSDYIISWVWPNEKVVYPDFLNEKTFEWWQNAILNFKMNSTHGAPFNGLWIDMNEPSSFETNELKPWNWNYPLNDTERYPLFTLKCPINRLDDPPYRTMNAFKYDDGGLLNKKARLSQKTICMIAIQGNDTNKYYHYDVHNLYGHTQAIATDEALRNIDGNKRPFVLSRSTFIGSGHYTAHWTGDVDSTWEHLRMSLIGLFEFNMFGIPMVGADICGFFGNTELELCQRWQQLGAFYPLSRNHNANLNADQDPAAFNDASIVRSTVETLTIRYTLLPYLYTLFYNVHIKGGIVVRPLVFEFPLDNQTFSIEKQFLLGPAFLVSPVLEKGETRVTGYFPVQSRWYDYRTGKQLTSGFQTLDAPREYINLHVRGGFILPLQHPRDALNTEQSRKNPFGLMIVLDEFLQAQGDLFWDNGDSIIYEKQYFYATFKFSKDQISMNIEENGYNMNHMDEILIYGATSTFKNVQINGQIINDAEIIVDDSTNAIRIKNLNVPLNANFIMTLLN